MVYITKSGDTFDMIAYKTLGDGYRMSDIIAANPSRCETMIFEAGIPITIPEQDEQTGGNNPPWFD